MSKTLVANPLWGLKGIPARIILDKKSLTIKNGIIGGKSMPYNSISSVEFHAVNSLTLAGTITIIPYRGAEVKADGFYKGQFKTIKQAVEDGYFDDSNDIGEENYQQYENNSGSSHRDNFVEQPSLQQTLQEVDINDEESIANTLNMLIGTIESEDTKDIQIIKEAKTKYNNLLGILRTGYPSNKLLPFFESKPKEWKEKERKQNLLVLYILLGFMLFFALVFLLV